MKRSNNGRLTTTEGVRIKKRRVNVKGRSSRRVVKRKINGKMATKIVIKKNTQQKCVRMCI